MLAQVCFGFLALIHLLPAVAAVAPKQITKLYGVDARDRTLMTLLQHRAVLLGAVGAAFVAAATMPHSPAALFAVMLGGASMASFLVIAALQRQLSGPLRKIVIVDAAGLLPLGWLLWQQPWSTI